VEAYECYVAATVKVRLRMVNEPIPANKIKANAALPSKDRLILSETRDSFPIGGERVANITKEFMSREGVDTDVYKSHSMRGAVASKMIDGGEDPADVMFWGRWKSNTVFQAFYNRAHKRQQHSNSLLQSYVS
jgi:hypothetical protein